MSNIPEARELLHKAVMHGDWSLVNDALNMMTRKKPAFVTPKKLKPLTEEQITSARALRRQRLSLREIAERLGTNSGRISEVTAGIH